MAAFVGVFALALLLGWPLGHYLAAVMRSGEEPAVFDDGRLRVDLVRAVGPRPRGGHALPAHPRRQAAPQAG